LGADKAPRHGKSYSDKVDLHDDFEVEPMEKLCDLFVMEETSHVDHVAVSKCESIEEKIQNSKCEGEKIYSRTSAIAFDAEECVTNPNSGE
jgi:hypothetical protein